MRTNMKTARVTRMLGAAAFAVFLALPAGCDDGTTSPEAPPPPPPTPIKASDWVKSVDWSKATVVQVNMVEQPGGALAFAPSNLTFEAGKPYIVRIVNPASNAEKHYFAVEGLGNFYQAIATRKIETSQAEYKAPYFDAVELMIGGSLDLYFVPVLSGTYDIVCIIPGHKDRGMVGTAMITGGEGNQLDLEVAADFNTALASDARKSSSHTVWSSRVDKPVTIVETPYSFVPTDLALNKDVAHKITLDNPSTNASKHYYTAAEFYRTVVTRKAEDSQAEIKVPYFNAIELMIGGKTQLFMVPTATGTFQTVCTITGHAEAGMKGTIVVTP